MGVWSYHPNKCCIAHSLFFLFFPWCWGNQCLGWREAESQRKWGRSINWGLPTSPQIWILSAWVSFSQAQPALSHLEKGIRICQPRMSPHLLSLSAVGNLLLFEGHNLFFTFCFQSESPLLLKFWLLWSLCYCASFFLFCSIFLSSFGCVAIKQMRTACIPT